MSNSKLKTQPSSKSSRKANPKANRPIIQRLPKEQLEAVTNPKPQPPAQSEPALPPFQSAPELLEIDPSVAFPGEGDSASGVGDNLAIGYRPSSNLTPSDKALFDAFQSNLLSLISHELRTPLTGVLNALGVLDSAMQEGGVHHTGGAAGGGLNQRELISMAFKNAQRLHKTLVTLLDLASIESGAFHARLREVDLLRVLRARWEAQAKLAEFKETGCTVELVSKTPDTLALADPQKVARALDVCFAIVTGWGKPEATVQAVVENRKVQFHFPLNAGGEAEWDREWSQGVAAFEGGVGSPSSVFGGVVQSEKGFLSRMREGLGSEFILVHQIMRLHIGTFSAQRKGTQITLALNFPEISADEGLRAILVSRAYVVSHELGSVALALIEIPASEDMNEFRLRIASKLFRTTDAVYVLPSRRQIALVLDDCKQDDARNVVNRFERTLNLKLRCGLAHCPGDVVDPSMLLEIAEKRLAETGAAR